jgi:outer membrane protein OmpA-like peptidoglycan-associated protein
MDDFRLTGEAMQTGSECILLTADRPWKSGAIWHKKPISLRAPFKATLKFMIGCKDQNGADGMVFVLHPLGNQQGFEGEGMGFAGLQPALGIEIDTWINGHLHDPVEDHIALLQNGSVSHLDNLAGPVKLPNLEDCRHHSLTVQWSPLEKQLDIYLDGEQVIQYQSDLRHDLFKGKDAIFWGITAATGDHSNRQEICFEKLDYTLTENMPPLSLTGSSRDSLIGGKVVILDNLQFNTGSATLKKLAKSELEEMVYILREHPEKRLDIFGHTDNIGSEALNQQLSSQRAQAVADFLISKGVDPKQLNPRGFGETYPIADNNTLKGRLKNRRVGFRLMPYYP